MKDADCVAFLQRALPRLGLHWPGFRKVRGQVCKRIDRRARELGLPDASAYRRHLEAHAREWDALAALCTIPISRFYRDRGVFDCLATAVLPALAEAALERGATRLECWSAGCASGEEAYTLAIQWQLALQPRFAALGFRVLGTDIDATLLERAQAGCYKASSLKELPAAWRERAFERRGELFCVRGQFRREVEFERRDLLAEPPQRAFDLIFCRNLALTYFGADLANAALRRIAGRLLPGGALVIGVHERLPPDAAGFAAWPGCRATFRLRPDFAASESRKANP
ncbi:MAG: protein-glutamate O-methyltransferase CheR [Burkholderiales bacterium]